MEIFRTLAQSYNIILDTGIDIDAVFIIGTFHKQRCAPNVISAGSANKQS